MITIKDLIPEYRKSEGIFRFFDKEDPEKTRHTMKWDCSTFFLRTLLREQYDIIIINMTTTKVKITKTDIKQLIAIAEFQDKM